MHTKRHTRSLRMSAALIMAVLTAILTPVSAADLSFVNVRTMSGIPAYGLTSLTTDDYGFVWAGSPMGILRVTPGNCKEYALPVSRSDVMQLRLAYGGSELYAATQNGFILRYDRIYDRFDHIATIDALPGSDDWVTNVAVDSDGHVWISTSRGIHAEGDDGKPCLLKETEGRHTYIIPGGKGKMFALIGNGFHTIDTSRHSIERLPGEFDGFISTACLDSVNNCILIGTYCGVLWRYDLRDHQLKKADADGIPGLIIRSILPAKDRIFLGVEGAGIMVLDRDGSRVTGSIRENLDRPESLKSNGVYSLLLDRQDRLWTCTPGGGLQYAETGDSDIVHLRHSAGDTQSIANNEVNGLMPDNNGNLWLATNDGISRLNMATGDWDHFLTGRQTAVMSMTADRHGHVYATTFGRGVYVLDAADGRIVRHLSNSDARLFGPGHFIFACHTDIDGDIWFGGVKGNVVCYSPSTGKFRTYGNHPVFCFGELPGRRILTGGGDGLVEIDKRTGKNRQLLEGEVVRSILTEGGHIWATTSGKGVARIDPESGNKTFLSTKDGLQSNFTHGVVAEGDELWISTSKGICCYNTGTGQPKPIPSRKLLATGVFHDNAVCRLADGRIAFGSSDGAIMFDPDSVARSGIDGTIFFSDIRVSGRSVRRDPSFTLSKPIDSLTDITIEYPHDSFTLSVIPLGDVSRTAGYSWLLEGLDKEWSEVSPHPYINYLNLKPGDYTLRVRMHDGSIWSERELGITVKPPFWQTWWFRTLACLLVLIIIYILIHRQILRIRRQHTLDKTNLYVSIAQDLNATADQIKAPIEFLHNEPGLSEDGRKYLDMASEKVSMLGDTVLQKALETDLKTNEDKRDMTERSNDDFLQKAIKCINDNIDNENFGKGEFASAMAMSQSLLYKKLKAVTDLSVVEFIRSIRLSKAMQLLQSREHTITEVSEMCGFSSPAYFSRVFKDYYGKTPSDIMQKPPKEAKTDSK